MVREEKEYYLNLKFILQLSFSREQTKKISKFKATQYLSNYHGTMMKYKILRRAKCQDYKGEEKRNILK